jgi:TPR repeat protein
VNLPALLQAAGLAVALSLLSGAAGAQSLEDVRSAAEAGDASAQASLGALYERGEGGAPQDFTLAAQWRLRAAQQGDASAANGLGRQYAQGLGVEQDYAEAIAWLGQAAQTGAAPYVHDLALMLEAAPSPYGDPARAVALYEQAAATGFASSQANLGFITYQGDLVEKDVPRALELLTAAAEQGHPQAQNNLGLIYSRGDGVEQDYETAFEWFALAAEQGLPQAMTNLGVMYESGFGVAIDEARATELYRRGGQLSGNTLQAVLDATGMPYDRRLQPPSIEQAALDSILLQAAAGDPIGLYVSAWLLSSEQGVRANFPLAAEQYLQAAEAGLAPAQLNLGLLYLRGAGVPQDYAYGFMWISRAAENGAPDAAGVRDAVLPFISADQVNAAQAMLRDGEED